MSNEPDRAIEPGAHSPPGAAADTAQSPYGTLAQSPEDQFRAAAVSSSFGVAVPGFEIEGELGRGGMGVVYRARQTGLNRPVALKMVIAGAYSDLTTRTRFLLEAESVAALEHTNIVKVFSFGEHDGHPFLAMEFLPGGNLADRVKTGGPLPAREATTLMAKVAAAVAHAHTRGVVHRDIKPANVLLTADGDPRLTDFGLAKVGRSDLSVTGQVLGTPAYMAPEQAAGRVREVGTPADVYALGAVLYDLLTGRPPFAGDSAAATLHMVLSCEPERLRKHEPGVPRDLETICMKCLEREPEKRYPTAQALADDLNRFLSGEPITARPAGSFERAVKWVKRHKGLSVGLFVAAMAVVLGVGASTWFGLWAMTEADRATNEAARATGKANDERQAREQAALAEKRALAALGEAQSQRITADRRQAELGFSNAMTSCEEGRVQEGLELFVQVVELAEANAAAEEPGDSKKAKEADRELARVARLNIAAWQRELPPLSRAFPHPSHVMGAEFLPDGKRFVTVSSGSQATLWDATTGEKIHNYIPPRSGTLTVVSPPFWAVAPSPNGKMIAVGTGDGQIIVWDTDSPTHRLAFEAVTPAAKKVNETNVFSLAFAPDGTIWAVDGDGGIQQWDLNAEAKPKLLARLAPEVPKGSNASILNVFALSADGKFAYTGDRSGVVREWKLETRTAGRVWQTAGWVQDLAVSPDGARLAATGPNTKVRVIDLRGNRAPFDIDLSGSYGNGVAFSGEQPILVSADNDGNIRFWHQDTGQSVGTPIRVAGDPRHTRFRAGSDQLIVPAANVAYVCTIPHPPQLVTMGRGGRVRGLDISPNGDRIASADDSFVDIFDTKTLNPIQNPVRANGIPRAIRFDVNSKRAQIFRGYISAFDRVVYPNGTQPQTIQAFGMGGVHRIDFAPNGSTMYLLGDTLISRFDPATLNLILPERPIKDLPPGLGLGALAVRPDGGELLITTGQRVEFLHPETLQPMRSGWTASGEIRDATYTRDGRAVLIGRRDNAAELLSADTGSPVVRPMPHARAVAAVAVSPKGTVLATGSRDNTARYWDTRTGLPIGPPMRHQSEVIYVVFEPNGNRMATGTSGGHVLLWDAPPQPAIGSLEALRARISRPKP
ncbi:MAG: protein kinase [Planctomycetes bacterium]|nr:protein kinase [Planctomycetota bacterium]